MSSHVDLKLTEYFVDHATGVQHKLSGGTRVNYIGAHFSEMWPFEEPDEAAAYEAYDLICGHWYYIEFPHTENWWLCRACDD